MSENQKIINCEEAHSQKEILEGFEQGKVQWLKGKLVFNDFVEENWGFQGIHDNYGEKIISRHEKFDGKTFLPSWKPVRELTTDLLGHKNGPLPGESERMALYGVTNSRRLDPRATIRREFLKHFTHSFSFMWVGLSPGGLHCDYFNNILFQLSGSKRITVFSPEFSEKISSNHYVALENKADILASENIRSNKGLEAPCYQIELNPGDAIAIPCAAYHAPRALTADSVSINAFFTPRGSNPLLSKFARKEDNYPWWVTNTSIGMSKLWFSLFGRPLLRTGHYEVM